MASCRSCGAEIVWATTARQRQMPLDVPPTFEWENLRGKFVLRDGRALPANAMPPRAQEAVYTSHFATCPDAAEHRK